MASDTPSKALEPSSNDERARFCSNYRRVTTQQTRNDAVRHSPLVSLAVKDAVNKPRSSSSGSIDDASSAHTSSVSQPSQSADHLTVQPLSISATSSSKLNPQSAPFTQYATTSPSATSLSALQANDSGGSFVQSPDTQHERQSSSHDNNVSDGKTKLLKQEGSTSASNGTFTSSEILDVSDSNATSQADPISSPLPNTSTDVPTESGSGATVPAPGASKSANPSALDSSFKPFGAGNYREPTKRPIMPLKSRRSAKPVQSAAKDVALPQYGLLGFDLDNCDLNGDPEPILLNTNSPSSVFLCGSQGSGKSYTLSCMLENHLLHDPDWGAQRETMPGFVFHWDTNTSGSLAEAASLCSRGIKVRLLVSWSNYKQMKTLYEQFAAKTGGKIEVRPLLFQDHELTVDHIRGLMAFRNGGANETAPLYLEVMQNILRRLGRQGGQFSVKRFLSDLDAADLNPSQLQMLDQRLNILKTFSAVMAPDIVKQDYKHLNNKALNQERQNQGLGFQGDCISVEHGMLTIFDLSDPFVDASTACVLFDICLAIILKRHKEAVTANIIRPGLIVTLDEAHKFLDKDIASADVFTSSLLTTIREQRHNAARVIIATQEPTISEKLLDLCSVTIVHRFNSPAWFSTLCGHLGGASVMTGDETEGKVAVKKAQLFKQILALQVGESLVFSPTSWVRGGALPDGNVVEPERLGSEVLRMRTRERKGEDSGKTWQAV